MLGNLIFKKKKFILCKNELFKESVKMRKRFLESAGLIESSVGSLALYRDTLRSLSDVKKYYDIPFTSEELRLNINLAFRKNIYVKDKKKVEELISSGRRMLNETKDGWMPRLDVLRFFAPTKKVLTRVKSAMIHGTHIPEEEWA